MNEANAITNFDFYSDIFLLEKYEAWKHEFTNFLKYTNLCLQTFVCCCFVSSSDTLIACNWLTWTQPNLTVVISKGWFHQLPLTNGSVDFFGRVSFILKNNSLPVEYRPSCDISKWCFHSISWNSLVNSYKTTQVNQSYSWFDPVIFVVNPACWLT